MKKLFNILCIALSLNVVQGQKLHVDIDWNGETIEFFDFERKKNIVVPAVNDASHLQKNGFLPIVYVNIPTSYAGIIDHSLIDVSYKEITDIDLSALDLPDEIQIITQSTINKKKANASVAISPLRKNPSSGKIELATSLDINLSIQKSPANNSRSGRSAKSTSVLSSGNWFKLGVQEAGIYRIDYDFMVNTLQIDLSNVTFNQIGLFGNGGGMLGENTNIDRDDDLIENAIQVNDQNNNGIFDQGDFILFYGESPHEWNYDASERRFKHIHNIYTDNNYYFLTTDRGNNKRISNQASLSGNATNVTTFNDYQFLNPDINNLIRSGRTWYGDVFSNFNPTKGYDFVFPNINTGNNVTIKTRVAGRSVSGDVRFAVTNNSNSGEGHQIDPVSQDYTAIFARNSSSLDSYLPSSNTISVQLDFISGDNNAEGWLDYIEVNAVRNLIFNSGQLAFRNIDEVGPGKQLNFKITNANSNLNLWDVSHPHDVKSQQYSISGSEIQFTRGGDTLREYILFDNSSFLVPEGIGAVQNQNLHSLGNAGNHPDMIIVAAPSLLDPATDLANLHRNSDNLSVEVINIEQIYNEFASGSKDITAIRDFVRMLYDRAGSDVSKLPDYLLLFGDGTFDFKEKLTNHSFLIPSYQSNNSLSPTRTFVSDDYFGFLDENEGDNIGSKDQKLDIAIGRLPASDLQQANDLVNKIRQYMDNSSFGSWRNDLVYIADDEDNNIHLKDADQVANIVIADHPEYNYDKIVMDAFPQVNTPGGQRYPDVNSTIQARMFKGALLVNYVGHGGVTNLAHERVFNIPEIQAFNNFTSMPAFVTATCEFSRYDDPERTSAGEFLILNPNGGAIAMITTVRIVYSHQNRVLNENFYTSVFEKVDGKYMTMGEVMRATKNKTNSDENNRKFTLLGDPALTLAYPEYNVATTQINGVDITSFNDTIKALSEVTISGVVTDLDGNILPNFNGSVAPVIYDKQKTFQQLTNDPAEYFVGDNYPWPFDERSSIIYKGKASVNNGNFRFSFIVPKDIDYTVGNGKISYYADNGVIDANGFSTDFIIGSATTNFAPDNQGPVIELFMNDEKFVNGGTTDKDPILLVKLEDESGINTVGNGIGHDITATLDGDSKNKIVLNDFYESELDSFQKGEVKYPLSDLSDGPHVIAVKAWDVHNNSSEATLDFVVVTDEDMALEHVLNYPNPFTTSTAFHFEHNRPGEPLDVMIQVFSVSGRLVKTIYRNIVSEGYRIDNIYWDGLDDYGSKLGNGPYLYKVNLKTADGKTAQKFEKLVILR